jgi:lysophospholipase L1-like esterase
MKFNSTMKRSVLPLLLSVGFAFLPSLTFASYQPGQTLNPTCPPSDGTCIVVASTSNANAVYPTYNIATWGDSLTAGNEDGTGVTYPTTLSSDLSNRPVYNGGVGGQISTQIASRMIADTAKSSWTAVIWAGRNNYTDPSTVEADIASMVASLGSNSHYLILSVMNGSSVTEDAGGAGYAQITGINNYLAATYPGHYFDIREWIIQNGLSQAGIATSSQDQTDYGNDVPPIDLRFDGIHLNAAGYQLVAQQVANFITTQLDTASTGVLTAANLPSIFANAFATHIFGPDSTTTSALTVSNSSLSTLFTVLDNGNAALGTSSPAAKLDVWGGTSVDTAINITNTQTNTSAPTLSLVFRQAAGNNGLVNGGLGAGGKIVSAREAVYGGSNLTQASNLQFYTAFHGADVERLRITSAGNVGIGTTSPVARLDVAGTNTNALNTLLQISSVTSTFATTTRMTLLSDGSLGLSSSTPSARLAITGSTSGAGRALVITTSSGTESFSVLDSGTWAIVGGTIYPRVSRNATTGGLVMDTVGIVSSGNSLLSVRNNGGSDVLTLLGGGNVGVGTSSPYARLSVWGTDAASSTLSFSVVNNSSTTVFAVFNGGNAQLSGTLTQSSDKRLKTNITSLDASSSLAAIDALTPVTYDWLDPEKGGVRQYGFIAQQVQQIFPELVSTTSATALTPDGTLGLNYLGLIAPIVEAVQGLAARLSSLEATVMGFSNSFTSKKVTTDELCFADQTGQTCITKSQIDRLLSGAPSVQISAPTLPVISGTTTPPSIDIQGANPAIINVGDSYTDLGAIVNDNQGHDLSYHTFINGVLSGNILIDTSATATDTIDYVAIDTWGNTSTSTRTVIIASPAFSEARQ